MGSSATLWRSATSPARWRDRDSARSAARAWRAVKSSRRGRSASVTKSANVGAPGSPTVAATSMAGPSSGISLSSAH